MATQCYHTGEKEIETEKSKRMVMGYMYTCISFRLIILSYFPETVSFAGDIQYLLPSIK